MYRNKRRTFILSAYQPVKYLTEKFTRPHAIFITMPISTRLPLIEYQKKVRLNLFAGVDMARNLDMPEPHYPDPQ
jgi:hypothetical protein